MSQIVLYPVNMMTSVMYQMVCRIMYCVLHLQAVVMYGTYCVAVHYRFCFVLRF